MTHTFFLNHSHYLILHFFSASFILLIKLNWTLSLPHSLPSISLPHLIHSSLLHTLLSLHLTELFTPSLLITTQVWSLLRGLWAVRLQASHCSTLLRYPYTPHPTPSHPTLSYSTLPFYLFFSLRYSFLCQFPLFLCYPTLHSRTPLNIISHLVKLHHIISHQITSHHIS